MVITGTYIDSSKYCRNSAKKSQPASKEET